MTDKPLKKRKQDSYPQEPGSEESDGLNMQGGNSDTSLTPKKINAASNGGSRPALMVSIDLQKAGRLIGQPVGVTVPNDHRHIHSKADGHVDEAAAGNRPEIIKQHTENIKKSTSSRQTEAPKPSQERWREAKHGDSKTENNKGRSDDRCLDTAWQKHDKHSDAHHRDDMNHEPSHINQREAQKSTSKTEPHIKHGEDRSRDRNKEKDRDKEVDINMEDARGRCKNRQSNKDRDRENTKGEDSDRDKVRNKKKDREMERDRQKDKDETKDRNKDRDKNKDRDESRDGNKVRDKNKDRDVDKDGEESRERHKDKDRHKETGVGTNKSKERDKNKDRDVGTSKNKDLSKDRNKDRGESRDRNKDKERNKVKARDEDSERELGKSKTKDRERDMMRSEDRGQVKTMDKNRDRERNREKDRERKQQSSQENCSRPPPEQHSKPESAAEKHDRMRRLSDPKGHQVTENPNAQNKQERRSDGSGSCKAANKQQSTETKLGQFPPFLFGGSSGSLKNFVIPKLTRNSKDPQPSDKLKEPLVRLKRVSLIESLNRRAKPVVVLQRLTTDEVKQIIKESRNTQSPRWSFNKSDRGMIKEYYHATLNCGWSDLIKCCVFRNRRL